MSHLTMGRVGITRYINDKAGLVEYRIRWTAEIDALAAKAAARRGVDTPTLIANAVQAAIAAETGPVTAVKLTDRRPTSDGSPRPRA